MSTAAASPVPFPASGPAATRELLRVDGLSITFPGHAPAVRGLDLELSAGEMLGLLSGRSHVVVSGLCLLGPGWEAVEHEETRVEFRPLSPEAIAAYVATGEWRGRAGGYAIQSEGAALVAAVEGDYLNVVGLPAALLVRLLAEHAAGAGGIG